MRPIVRIVVPVLSLCVALASIYLYMDTTLPYFAGLEGRWLTVSHLLLPLAFLTIHLTNRRYGPAYAFAQIVLSFAVLTALTLFGGAIVQKLLPESIVPSVREVASFSASFFVAGFLSIVAFDGARGPRWWSAPLVGSIVAALIYVPIFYPASFLGTPTPWFGQMAIHAALLMAGSVLTLFPFWLLRGVVQPLPGFGGY